METKSLKFLLDSPIAFHRCLAKITGSVCSGLMLSQAVYWSNRTTDPDGWFWKTQEEWEEETTMSRYEQETARKLLKKTGFWEEKLIGVPAKMHYRINFEVLDKVLSQTSMGESHKLDCGKTPNKNDGLTLTNSTQITSEKPSNETALPVELPPRFPKSEKEAITACMAQALPDDFVIELWNETAARGGKDRNGNTIPHWNMFIKSAWLKRKNFQAERKQYDRPLAMNGRDATQPFWKTMSKEQILAEVDR